MSLSTPSVQHSTYEICCRFQAVLKVQKGAEAIAESYSHSLLESKEQYDKMYQRSIQDPAGFWSDMAKQFYWKKQVSVINSGCC